jgi:hypothetical protein
MKKYPNWLLSISLILIIASALTYTIHYFLFRDLHHIFIYMIGDFGFLFLDVLLVIFLIERLLSRREKRSMMNKMNMVIGTFFSEVGLELLSKFSDFVLNSQELEKELNLSPDWDKKDFKKAMAAVKNFPYEIKIDKSSLSEIREFLLGKRSFLMRLLENPNLLEHERFTDLLWAVFHLTEELVFRGDLLQDLPETDYKHLNIDLQRAYSQLTIEWISYTAHLKESYPFLYSLAARVNPMNPQASPVVS